MLSFLFEATLISLSGVLAPGPITAVVVGEGNASPHAGAFVALGHGLVELPLMVAVFYGVGQVVDLPYVRARRDTVLGCGNRAGRRCDGQLTASQAQQTGRSCNTAHNITNNTLRLE